MQIAIFKQFPFPQQTHIIALWHLGNKLRQNCTLCTQFTKILKYSHLNTLVNFASHCMKWSLHAIKWSENYWKQLNGLLYRIITLYWDSHRRQQAENLTKVTNLCNNWSAICLVSQLANAKTFFFVSGCRNFCLKQNSWISCKTGREIRQFQLNWSQTVGN